MHINQYHTDKVTTNIGVSPFLGVEKSSNITNFS